MSNLNFSNTEIAFSYKSNRQLLRDYQIFRLINQEWLVNFSISAAASLIKMGIKSPIAIGMRPTIYEVFCGGDTLQDASKKIEKLYSYKVKCILDYGVEGTDKEEDFIRTENAIKASILFAKNNNAVEIVSSKFTGLIPFTILEKLHANIELSEVEQEVYQKAKDRIFSISQFAYENEVSLFVDAEESWIQNPLDELTFELMQQFNLKKPIIYNTVQLYRKDRLAFLKNNVERAANNGFLYGVKIVRGAYMEKEAKRAKKYNYENPIQPNKAATDRDYNEAITFALSNLDKMAVCIATHNEESTLLATQLMQQNGIENNHPHIHFSQLLGMSDHITFNLAKENYNAGKYMPYGSVKDVIPYLIRRAQENTSVSGQMGRELKLLKTEVKRRGLFSW